MKSKGFTLIELLVVIAIIGILSAVVLASLDSARNKATDAAARADLDSSRAQSELYYDANSLKYNGVCTTATGATPGGIMDMLNAAASTEGATYSQGDVAAGSALVVGHDPSVGTVVGTGWAAAVYLKNAVGGNQIWCVDSTGTSTAVSALALHASACP